MRLDPETCYEILLSNDRRFDGWFFVGVSSTGVYCRSVCPVRTPKRQNCHFFPTTVAAEKAGFRPCMRCRPELAPGNGLLDISGNLARAAATLIEEGFLNGKTVTKLAQRIGVTERHLRRIFVTEFGVSIIEFVQTHRLLMAKRLLTDTSMPISTVASVAGFGSVRRFNDLFSRRYGFNPLRLRKGKESASATDGDMIFMLSYRPPFAWSSLLNFLSERQINGVEYVDEQIYARVVEIPRQKDNLTGWITVRNLPRRYAVEVTVAPSLIRVIAQVLACVKRLFDLGSRPDLIDAHLDEFASGLPGIRVPGSFDGIEIAVRAVVGQKATPDQTRNILSRIAARFGSVVKAAPFGLVNTFPSARTLSSLHPAMLVEMGLTRRQAETIGYLANAVASGDIVLEPMTSLEETLAFLRAVPGISEWAVQYIAMRAMAWPNAYPESDDVVMKYLCADSPTASGRLASQWEPWRAYATMHLWRLHEVQSQG
ncbi:DNA-3-methyladenine glycosylase 2 family protein [Paraburkholderia humisilvae]|uniref:Putative bifunctional transcriptional activator/DNA repair enzyme AlkA n=1 Tax=Paraburkholderia humisilvae TaxID=627669 RepID=A0A6J5EV20_9BURK|nr:AlkA N-terminal domain-containing protein [Paraburkholderia humisilvae]CAB3770073.1 putative bifunctional transcriptional activator/DNA repair enzyme AlkA [Paraburkholderia humisilvae]